jgi:hypothetical protein
MSNPITCIGPCRCLRLGVRSGTNKELPSTIKVQLRNTIPCCISSLTLIKLIYVKSATCCYRIGWHVNYMLALI